MFHIKTILTSKLNRVNYYKIRDEYKLKDYTNYQLPSVRFASTVHDITKSGMDTLDQKVDQYLQKWCKWR